MTKIYNSEVLRGLAKDAGIQQSVDKTPNELAEKIIPSFETNPKLVRDGKVLGSAVRTTSGDATILTTNATNETYVTGLNFCMIKDAACDKVSGHISVSTTINSLSTILAAIPVLVTTAQDTNLVIQFKHPIKIDKNVTIVFALCTYTAGLCMRSAVIYGYEKESSL